MLPLYSLFFLPSLVVWAQCIVERLSGHPGPLVIPRTRLTVTLGDL